MIEKIQKFQNELQSMTDVTQEKWPQDRFYLLLSMIPCLISHEYTDRMELCPPEKVDATKEHLKKVGVEDQKSLYGHLQYNCTCGEQYEQFLSFWEGNPCFDETKLKPEGKEYFHFCMEYAKQFQPLVKKFGFHAWDIGEGIHRIREAYTCGYLKEEDAKHDIEVYTNRARHYFHNFRDFAISYVCGATYYMMRESRNEEPVQLFQDMILKACHILLFSEDHNEWARVSWLPESIYFKELMEVKDMGLTQGTLGCFVTDRVSAEQYVIGYFYHDTPAENVPDSGWRFFAGDEDKDYLSDVSHTHIFSLNTVVNVFPEILPWLDEPVGTAVVLGNDGKYYKVDLENE